MFAKIQHLLNLDMQRFITVGGLQGSGKSTIVNEFEKVGYKVVCPDRIRVEFAQKEHGEDKLEGELIGVLQNFESKVWAITQERIIQYLKDGYSVIFDATNTSIKARKQILAWGRQAHMLVIAIYIECPLKIALERNEKRGNTITGYDKNGNPIYGRSIPDFVIKNKAKSQVLPTILEGFTEVYILHVDLREQKFHVSDSERKFVEIAKAENLLNYLTDMHTSGELKKFLPDFDICWDIDQENKYHNLKLHEHMIKAAEYVQKEDGVLFIATLIHDIGKFPTKKKYAKLKFDTNQFKIGEKVEIQDIPDKKGFVIARKLDYTGEYQELLTIAHVELDSCAHYYEHEKIGAIMARRTMIELGFNDNFADLIYIYVLYHMDLPYQTFSEKSMNKLIDKVGRDVVKAMVLLKKADKNASASNDINQYLENFQKIEEMLK